MGAVEEGLDTSFAPLCAEASTGSRGWTETDGEADAARSCSSRLAAPATAEGGGFDRTGKFDFAGSWKGNVDGSGGCWPVGRVASLKRRPLGSAVSGMGPRQMRKSAACDCKTIAGARRRAAYFSMSLSFRKRTSLSLGWSVEAHLSGTSR